MGLICKLADATRFAPVSRAGCPPKLKTNSFESTGPKPTSDSFYSTPQELLLMQRIIKEYGTREYRLQYLKTSTIGPDSIVAKGDWQLWRLTLELLTLEENWESLFETTGKLLKRARTKDESGELTESRFCDWSVWESYIRAALEVPGRKSVIDYS